MIKLKEYLALLLICLSFVIFSAPVAEALVADKGIDIFDIKGGARPMGLGGAFTGLSDDGYSLFYNPAGITRAKGLVVTVRDLDNFFAGQIYPLTSSVSLGLGFVKKTISDIPSAAGTIESSSDVLLASVGLKLGFMSDILGGGDVWRDIDAGLDLKHLLGSSLGLEGGVERAATGFEADFGMLWRTSPWMRIGAVFENFLGSTIDYDFGDDEKAISTARIGVGAKVLGDRRSPFYLEDNELILSSDLSLRSNDPSTLISFGAEWIFSGTYMLRAGMRQYAEEAEAVSSFTAGLGAKFGYWKFDVSVTMDSYVDAPCYYFSFLYFPKGWTFVRKPEEKEKVEVKEEERGELVWIIGPEEQLVTDDESVTIKGIVLKPGVSVYINDNPVQVKEDKKFEVVMPLQIGKNLIEILTEYKDRRVLVKRKVLRKAKVLTPEDVELEKKIAEEIAPKEAEIEEEEELIKPREEEISAATERIEEIEEESLTEAERLELEEEKKRIEARKKEVEAEKARIAKKRKELEAAKKKLEEEKKEIEAKKAAVEELATLGIIDISPDEVFEVESAITRGELASWLVKARAIPAPAVTEDPFTDVSRSHPLAAEIKAAVDAGFISPYADGSFRPDRPVTEEEGVEIFERYGN